MSDDDKVKPVEALIPQVTDELRRAVETHRRNLPFLIEYQQLQAKVTRKKFEALVDEGFTDKQAIELCKEQHI